LERIGVKYRLKSIPYINEAKRWRYSSARDYEGIEGLIAIEKYW